MAGARGCTGHGLRCGKPGSAPGLCDADRRVPLAGAHASVRVRFEFDPTADLVLADKVQIQQVLLKLLRNAVEAMESSQKRELVISTELKKDGMITISVADTGLGIVALERGAGGRARRQSDIGGGTLIRMALAARECELNGKTRKGCDDMRTTWCVIFAASAMMATIDGLLAQPEENPGRNEFLRSCASCHGVSGKGDGPVAKSLRPPPSDLTRLSAANNGVFPVSRVHEVIDGRIERLVHGTRDMPVWGDRYMREMISPESRDFVSKEWAEAIVRRRILALVEYISTLQRATRRSR